MKPKQFISLTRFKAVRRLASLLGRDRIAGGVENLMVMEPDFIRDNILDQTSRNLFDEFGRKVSAYEIASVLGAVSPFDAHLLFNLCVAVRPRRILEIGTHLGYSTTFLAGALAASQQSHGDGRKKPVLTTVDIMDVNGDPAAPWRCAGFSQSPMEVLRALSLDEFVRFHAGAATRFFAGNDETYDLIFIDGEHSYAAALNDIGHSLECIAPRGIIALHDYYGPGTTPPGAAKPIRGVRQAVQYLTGRYPSLEVLPLQSVTAIAGAAADDQPHTSLALLCHKN